jgi:hypothetical protein
MWTEKQIEEKAKEILKGWRDEGNRWMSITTTPPYRCHPVSRLDSETDTDGSHEFHSVFSKTALKAVMDQLREELKDIET